MSWDQSQGLKGQSILVNYAQLRNFDMLMRNPVTRRNRDNCSTNIETNELVDCVIDNGVGQSVFITLLIGIAEIANLS